MPSGNKQIRGMGKVYAELHDIKQNCISKYFLSSTHVVKLGNEHFKMKFTQEWWIAKKNMKNQWKLIIRGNAAFKQFYWCQVKNVDYKLDISLCMIS